MRIECPKCSTGYTPERMGIKPTDAVVKFTCKCVLCGSDFEGQIDPVMSSPGRFARWVLRRKPSLTHTSTSRLR